MKDMYPRELLDKLEYDDKVEDDLRTYWLGLDKQTKQSINKQARENSIKEFGEVFGDLDLSKYVFKIELLKTLKYGENTKELK